ncbi:MAG: hypothetical protein GX633_08920 [Clostridiales bacterium]|nr:hypothetical protein [Clostridiales bacterium]
MKNLPKTIYSGPQGNNHVQGIAIDTKREYIYYSFTTKLIKSDMAGNIVGSVNGLIGHMGCLDFNDADGKVYGSLEFKQDSIGKGILKSLGINKEIKDAFYIAVFDVDKIDRMDMDAEKDGVMKTVYLKDVVEDYLGTSPEGKKHVHGCSGIDGIAFGPDFGDFKGEKQYLKVAYGIYSDVERNDNDHQVILSYDVSDWDKYLTPLSQGNPHENGPEKHRKYFVYTGNTVYGVQNLEYDGYTGNFLMAVYKGQKEKFPNYPMYAIDGSAQPEEKMIDGKTVFTVPLLKQGAYHEASGIYGFTFEWGSTGLFSLDNGFFYVSHHGKTPEGEQTSTVRMYRYTGAGENPFEIVEEN